MLQSWYSTGDPTQVLGLVLPSAVKQLRFRVRKPLEHCWEQPDHNSHSPQRTPWGWDGVRPLVFTRSSTSAGKDRKGLHCFMKIHALSWKGLGERRTSHVTSCELKSLFLSLTIVALTDVGMLLNCFYMISNWLEPWKTDTALSQRKEFSLIPFDPQH